jgi:hypothetical protein
MKERLKRGKEDASSAFGRTNLVTTQSAHSRVISVPTGPNRPKRPADVVGNAIKVARIAIGEEQEDAFDGPPAPEKNPAAVEMGKLGGKKRAETMTPERRAEIARKAAASRWGKG